MTNAHKQNVLLSSLSEEQAAEHVELTIWEAGFDVDPATEIWHYSRPDDKTCIILNRSSMSLVICHEDEVMARVVEVPVTVTVGDKKWLLSRNHIDALIDMHIEVLRQAMSITGGEA